MFNHKIKIVVLMIFCTSLMGSEANAVELIVRLSSTYEKLERSYVVDTKNGKFNAVTDAIRGRELQSSNKYKVVDANVVLGSKKIYEAHHILFQGTDGGSDIVVVQKSRDSFSNPWRMLRAISGHPVTMKKITMLVLEDEKIVKTIKLFDQVSYDSWRARLWHAGPSE